MLLAFRWRVRRFGAPVFHQGSAFATIGRDDITELICLRATLTQCTLLATASSKKSETPAGMAK